MGAFASRWSHAHTALERTLALVSGLDASARLLCAAWIGVIAASPDPRWRIDAGNAIVARAWLRRKLRPSEWVQMSARLAAIVARNPEGPLGAVARSLADAGGLTDDLCHALDLAEDREATDLDPILLDHLASLGSLCRPVRELRLVAFGTRKLIAGEGEAAWTVRVLRGPEPTPDTEVEWHLGAVTPGSCFLVDATGHRTPLAPVLCARACTACGALEPHAADVLSFADLELDARCLRCGRSVRVVSAVPHLRPLRRAVSIWSKR